FQMRVGLNTGLVVVGSVGSDLHMEYLAIGDAVNLAARLQSAAQPGKVLISESTAHLVQNAFTLQPLGEITVKGKSGPVSVFEVGESISAAHSRRGYAELRSPLVGREVELESLHSALQGLTAGLGQIVTITGEAGIGKSRLVEEACDRMQQGKPSACREVHWLEGRALSYGQKLSYWIIRQLLQQDLGLSDGDPELKMRLALRRRVQTLFAGSADQVLPYLANLLGVQLEGELAEQVSNLDGETLKHQTLLSITSYFTRLAETGPTVLVFDDLHWADPSSLESLDGLLPITDHAPLMLLLISRLEREHPSWQLKLKAGREYAHRYTEITLQPLSGDEQNRLVDNLLSIADMPETIRRLILERAEGNPLFLEEILRHLIDQGAIVREDERWRPSSEISNIRIPETLRGVLLARIDRLQEDARRTLQLASVIGKSFLFRLLDAIAEAEIQLGSQLALLQRADLVREKARLPELEYIFKHSLTQEAAYQSLLLEQRRQFHHKVGHAMEALFVDRREEFLGLLAYHFDAAGEAEKAIYYLIHAGDKARLSDEQMEAVGFYQRALEIINEKGDDDRAAQIWLKLGLVYHANLQFDATYQAYENAFKLKQKHKSSNREALAPRGKNLCSLSWMSHSDRFDPGRSTHSSEIIVIERLFSGLAQVDNELNVIPDVARSWQVLEGGRRYLFHLRQDVSWTDGTPVTAQDFEYAWKRNLHPSEQNLNAQSLYDIVGAEDYHLGRYPDPDIVGVHALEPYELEVNLLKPVAYFPYIICLPVTFPLPRNAIETFGDDWWKPEHIVSNGAFRLISFTSGTSLVLERFAGFHGEFQGNLNSIQYLGSEDYSGFGDPIEGKNAYLENRADITRVPVSTNLTDIPPEEKYQFRDLSVGYLVINPILPPFTDLRLRKALSLALDRDRLFKNLSLPPVYGGVIPPGMPGHTPMIGVCYDPETARRLISDAGYPNGSGLPIINAISYKHLSLYFSEIIDQWRDELGIQVKLEISGRPERQIPNTHITLVGWIADFPDPDNILRQSSFNVYLHMAGWQDRQYDQLIQTAASLPDRRKRMALYRQADRLVVIEQVLILPLEYSSSNVITLVKPWVKNYTVNLLSHDSVNQVIIEDH
ncbi:MAG: 4-phytase, partial [Chloroflexi bacterium]|nr:4-phytase [Chloroflexota bacterium]